MKEQKVIIVRDGKEQDIPSGAKKMVEDYLKTSILVESYNEELNKLYKEKKDLSNKLYRGFKIRFKTK